MIEKDDKRLKFVSLEEASSPKDDGFYRLMTDRHWSVCPERGLILYMVSSRDSGSPQCNSNQVIAENLTRSLYPWATSVLVPRAFIRTDPRDYA